MKNLKILFSKSNRRFEGMVNSKSLISLYRVYQINFEARPGQSEPLPFNEWLELRKEGITALTVKPNSTE